MSARQVFSESEKSCLQDLIIKHKLNSTSALAAGNPAVKKMAWTRLVEEFNSIESNSKRTEAQLKKCWDNLKTRKKAHLAYEKKERMRTGSGPFIAVPDPCSEPSMLVKEESIENTDIEELRCVIDSDNLPPNTDEELLHNTIQHNTAAQENIIESAVKSEINSDVEIEIETDAHARSFSHHKDNSIRKQHKPGGNAKNIRSRVIDEEFHIRKENYKSLQKREEEVHQLIMQEKKWLVKVAEEKYKLAVLERKNAEIILRQNLNNN